MIQVDLWPWILWTLPSAEITWIRSSVLYPLESDCYFNCSTIAKAEAAAGEALFTVQCPEGGGPVYFSGRAFDAIHQGHACVRGAELRRGKEEHTQPAPTDCM